MSLTEKLLNKVWTDYTYAEDYLTANAAGMGDAEFKRAQAKCERMKRMNRVITYLYRRLRRAV